MSEMSEMSETSEMSKVSDYSTTRSITIASESRSMSVRVHEFVTHQSQCMFTWDSAYVLAAYINANCSDFQHKSIVELGSGTGLPSLVAALCQAKSCILTERADEPHVLENLDTNIKLNNVEGICRTMPLSWGPITDKGMLKCLECDYILGSDIFYSTESFLSIFLTIASIMTMNRNTVFITTYQERSIKRTIRPWLDMYDMEAKVVPRSSFLHAAHRYGYCSVVNTNTNTNDNDNTLPSKRKANESDDEMSELNEMMLPSYENIYLIVISLRK